MGLRYRTIIKTLPDTLDNTDDGRALYESLVKKATGYRAAVVAEEEAKNRRDSRLLTFEETTTGRFRELVDTIDGINGVLVDVRLPINQIDLGDFVREFVDYLYEGRRR